MYKSIVEEARKQFLTWQEQENKRKRSKVKSKPALWPSDLLSCKRKAAHHLIGSEPTLDFNYQSLSYMDGGNVSEDATARAMEHVYNAKQNVTLRNGVWSGKADFIINFKQADPIIVEHKATGERKFKDSKQLPRREHVAQLSLYGYLYEQIYGVKPKLVLYYKGWGHFADFTLDVQATRINVSGLIDDYFVSKNLRIDIQKEIEDLEWVYRDAMAGKPLPDRLANKNSGCSFMGRPSCSYYYNCYPDEQR
jgi:hypothetical protein